MKRQQANTRNAPPSAAASGNLAGLYGTGADATGIVAKNAVDGRPLASAYIDCVQTLSVEDPGTFVLQRTANPCRALAVGFSSAR